MSDTFRIHTLGCGSAKPSMRHNPSCTVVEYRDNLFMVDCGEGAQQQFQRQRLKFSRLRHIFLTHLHGDHVFGLPGLVGTLALSGIEGNLTIHTFKDGKEILGSIFNYFNRGLPIDVEFNVIGHEDAVIFENKTMRVRTVALDHRIPAVGYVFEEKEKPRHLNRTMCDFHGVNMAWYNRLKNGEDYVNSEGIVIPNHVLTTDPTPSKSYAHISDTAYMPELADKIRGVDLLMHETTYCDDKLAQAIERGHSTARQAATVARDAGVGRLLTGHYSSSIKDESLIVDEALQVFPKVILNREGLVLDV